jgi:23S rRNA A1618 N6-methylase RlmF
MDELAAVYRDLVSCPTSDKTRRAELESLRDDLLELLSEEKERETEVKAVFEPKPLPPHSLVRDPDPPVAFSALAGVFPPLAPFLREKREQKKRKRGGTGGDEGEMAAGTKIQLVEKDADRPPKRARPDSVCPDVSKGVFSEALGSTIEAQGDQDDDGEEGVDSDWATLNFRDPAAFRTLQRALFSVRFQLDIQLPEQSLCPTVSLRSNYVRWLQLLLGFLRAESTVCPTAGPARCRCARGVDVGTGSSCVYPLLGCAMSSSASANDSASASANDSASASVSADSATAEDTAADACGWSFVATDVDPHSLEWARRNVERNPVAAGRVEFVLNAHPERLLLGVVPELSEEDGRAHKEQDCFDFVMCNPPFFEGDGETHRNRKSSIHAHSKRNELVFDATGGEVAFIGTMIDESAVLRGRVVWYTTMLGRKASLGPLRRKLGGTDGITCVRTAEFIQGRTTRWGLAWSYTE